MEDFSEEMLANQNTDVDNLCGCTGKEKTRSRRVEKRFHDEWCFYYQHMETKLNEQLAKWRGDAGN